MELYVQFNMNSYCAVRTDLTFYEKIDLFVEELIKKYMSLDNITAILLTEYIAGSNAKYLDYLEDKLGSRFSIIPPCEFNYLKHSRSLITVTCINRNINYINLSYTSCLANRINNIKIFPDDDRRPVRLLGCYMVQTQIFSTGAAKSYIAERKKLQAQLWTELIAQADPEGDEDVIVWGDLQKNGSSEEIQELKDMGYKEIDGNAPTVFNSKFQESSIDHLLLNSKTRRLLTTEYDSSVWNISDHAMLASAVL